MINMNGADNVLQIVKLYIGHAIVPMIAIIGLALFMRKHKQGRTYILLCLLAGGFIFNDFIYSYVVKKGEAATFYRFLWCIPLIVISAVTIVYVFNKITDKWNRVLGFGVIIIVGLTVGNIQWNDLMKFPENIYQMPQDMVDVADMIDADRAGKYPAVVLADNTIMYGIREYNANIQEVLEGDTDYLELMLQNDDCNMQGILVKAVVRNSKIDYIVLKKENNKAKKLLVSGGASYIGETDQYAVFRTNYDWNNYLLTRNYSGGFLSELGVYDDEDVDVQALTDAVYEFVYYPDNHVALVNSETGENIHSLNEEKAFQMLEYDQFIICSVDDSSGRVDDYTLEQMREAVKTGKEIILLLKKPIYQEGITKVDDNQLLLGEDWNNTDSITREFIELVKNDESHIAAVFTCEKAEYSKLMLNENTWQCVCESEEQIGTTIRVR